MAKQVNPMLLPHPGRDDELREHWFLDSSPSWLLAHLRRTRGKHTYSRDHVALATIWLAEKLEREDHRIPPGFVDLLRELLKPKRRVSFSLRDLSPVREKNWPIYMNAMLFEIENPEASVYEVAKHIVEKFGLERQAAKRKVSRWRKQEEYLSGIQLARGASQADSIS